MSENRKLLHETLESRLPLTGLGFESHIVDSVDALAPIAFQVADLDGDGKEDLLVGSAWESEVSWYKNAGGGIFESQRVISSDFFGDHLGVLQATDIDGDGDLDIIAAVYRSFGGALVWLENIDGRGNFESKQVIDPGVARVKLVTSADIDSDGDQDVVLASSRGITWYENLDGAGTFGSMQEIINGGSPFSATTADFDGDGDPDILVAFDPSSGPGSVVWYENLGGGKFDEIQEVSSQVAEARVVQASDLDGDGDVDVLSTSAADGKIAWHENTDGRGTFDSEQVITTDLLNVFTMHAADFDGDGDRDVVAAQYRIGDAITWYENTDGKGTFGSAQVITTDATGVVSVLASDLDGDGDQDVALASFFDDKIAWHENVDGKGMFGLQQVVSEIGNTAASASVADIDSDGDYDLLTATNKNNHFGWYENIDGKGTFGEQQIIDTPDRRPGAVHAADFDGDGDLDVLAESGHFIYGSVAWYENVDGRGIFGAPQDIATGGTQAFVDDLDADGDPDVIFVSGRDIVWVENRGAGTFAPMKAITTINAVRTIRPADLDGDGDKDLVVAASFNRIRTVVWLERFDENGKYGPPRVVNAEFNLASSAVPSDIDGDGDQDIVTAVAGDDKIVWFENNGQAEFGEPQVITNVDAPSYAETADVDGDGDQDILAATRDHKLAWYENEDGQGNFGPHQVIASQADYTSAFGVDLDEDGDQDVVAYSAQFGVGWYEQRVSGDSNDDGIFNSADLVAVFQSSEYEDGIFNNSTFSEGDWNNDGEFDSSDIVFAFQVGNYVHAAKVQATLAPLEIDSVFAGRRARAGINVAIDAFVFRDDDLNKDWL